MDKIYIFGHQKPDCDAITSAISLSYLKNKLGLNTIPARIGDINRETRYVLDYFKVKEPIHIDDVKLQLKDLDYHKNCFINKNTSIKNAYDYMINNKITGVPIVDDNNYFLGLATIRLIANEIINKNFDKLNTSYDNILDTINGKKILKFDDSLNGDILACAYRSTTFLDIIKLKKDSILIVGDRYSVIEYAIKSKVKLIILVGGCNLKEELLELAKENKVNIIETDYDTYKTIKLINLSNYISNTIDGGDIYTFYDDDYYDDFKIKSSKLKHNNYPIIDRKNKCKGLIRITDITNKNNKKVILVDHNEMDQSVEGLEEAEIIEIVDHHKIGSISTRNPINFRNMAVGSTNTIVFQMYKENNILIPKDIAGLMLAGILSDTLILTSPTTTEYDEKAIIELSKIAEVDYKEFGLNMFKVGTSLYGKTVKDVVLSDIKTFSVNDIKFAVSQVFTLDYDNILNNKNEYIDFINDYALNKDYRMVLLVVTDIYKNGSYLFYTNNDDTLVSDAFSINDIKQGEFVEKIVSRKKQIVPKLIDVMR